MHKIQAVLHQTCSLRYFSCIPSFHSLTECGLVSSVMCKPLPLPTWGSLRFCGDSGGTSPTLVVLLCSSLLADCSVWDQEAMNNNALSLLCTICVICSPLGKNVGAKM